MSDTSATPEDRPLRRDKAAAYVQTKYGIPCAPATLAKKASIGGGPRFRHVGRWPVYAVADLDAWAQSVMSPLKSSTSEVAA